VPVGQPRADVGVGEPLAQAGARGERFLADVAHHNAAAEHPGSKSTSERSSARKDTSPYQAPTELRSRKASRSGAIRPSRTFRGSGSRSDPSLATPPAARVTRDPGADRKSPLLRIVKYAEGRRQRRGGKRGSCDVRRRTGTTVADRSGKIHRVRVGLEGRSRRSRSAPRAQLWAAPRPPRSLPHPEPARTISGSRRSSHPSRWSLTIPAACISA
jgi:hypothetical protein